MTDAIITPAEAQHEAWVEEAFDAMDNRSDVGVSLYDLADAAIQAVAPLIYAEGRRAGLEDAVGVCDERADNALATIKRCRPGDTEARQAWLYDYGEDKKRATEIRALIGAGDDQG